MKTTVLAGMLRTSALAGLLALCPALARGEIVHQPIGCMVAGQLPLIEATFEPADSIARARVYFHTSLAPTQADYYVEMTDANGRLVGKLPRPKLEAVSVTYFIWVISKDGNEFETPPAEARVVVSASDCAEGIRLASPGPPGHVTVFSRQTGQPTTSTGGDACVYGDTAKHGNLRLGAPQKVSLMLGRVLAASRDASYCASGVLLAVEPGIGGGKLSLGFSKTSGASGDVVSRAAKITLLRTWWKPWLADRNATYLGVELTTSLWFHCEIVGSVGLLRRIAERPGSRDWVVTVGIGLGQ